MSERGAVAPGSLEARARRGLRRGLRALGLDLPRDSLLDRDPAAFLHAGRPILPRGRRALRVGALARRARRRRGASGEARPSPARCSSSAEAGASSGRNTSFPRASRPSSLQPNRCRSCCWRPCAADGDRTEIVFAGLALGMAGLLVLSGPGTFGGGRFHLGASASSSPGRSPGRGGSLFSRGSRLPATPIMATAATLLTGRRAAGALGLAAGELGRFDPAAVSTRSVVATVYLLIFGSIVGFSAYLWLLRVTTASRVSTYAYVNPDRRGVSRAGRSRTSR